MYIVTFYSFKGGVGRTMALVNTAIELANRGRRVLVVDFDLEAPGIPTFDIFSESASKPGIVDYVSTYLANDVAPDIRDYVFECKRYKSGSIWVLPAGKQDDAYSAKLSAINWPNLYSDRDGYLLFEDMRHQWKSALAPDYVLIDSRTGHTDVGGICTRQLPDSVIIMFFPNEQNLWGLTKVVDDVRAEALPPRQKHIQLHFVPSNVPDLDDEDRILEDRIGRFKSTLGYDEPTTVIHHYNSLVLLNQTIFTKDRPRSRLTKEYLQLVTAIVENNLEDKDAAVATLTEMQSNLGKPDRERDMSLEEIENKLAAIASSHSKDGEILYRMGIVRERMGNAADAVSLYTAAIDAHFQDPPVYMRRAFCFRTLKNDSAAVDDIKRVLRMENASERDLVFAARWLGDLEPRSIGLVERAPSLARLDHPGRIRIANEIEVADEAREVVERLLRSIITDPSAETQHRASAEHRLVLCLVGLQRYQEAISLLTKNGVDPSLGALTDRFNYAMAQWGHIGTPTARLFERVIEKYLSQSESVGLRDSPNVLQCIGLSYAIVNQRDVARDYLSQARTMLDKNPKRNFSCWRYLETNPHQFAADLAEMRRFVMKPDIMPTFMTREAALPLGHVALPPVAG